MADNTRTAGSGFAYMRINVCMHVGIYVPRYQCNDVFMYVCMYVCTYACMHVYVCVGMYYVCICMYVCT